MTAGTHAVAASHCTSAGVSQYARMDAATPCTAEVAVGSRVPVNKTVDWHRHVARMLNVRWHGSSCLAMSVRPPWGSSYHT